MAESEFHPARRGSHLFLWKTWHQFQSNRAQHQTKILCKFRICCRGAFQESRQDSLPLARKCALQLSFQCRLGPRKDTRERFYSLVLKREEPRRLIFARQSRQNSAG